MTPQLVRREVLGAPASIGAFSSTSRTRRGSEAGHGLSLTLMIWYYWTTMPDRRASRMAVVRNVLADAGYSS